MYKCEYCKKTYSSNGSLNKHQKTAKHCRKIQSEDSSSTIESISFDCAFCGKSLTSKIRLNTHLDICIARYNTIIKQQKDEIREVTDDCNDNIEKLNEENEKLKKRIIELAAENNLVKEQLSSKDPYIYIRELQEKLHEVALSAIDQKNEVITNMTKKFIKKQPRKQYECQNVIYILTTSSLQKDRRYILGKAKNLTSRLSTYNKSDEHEVIFYQECEDEEAMTVLEPFVFKKLDSYREQANRERFILPENKNIDFFIDTIKNCYEFLK
jgi:hypothetical protein